MRVWLVGDDNTVWKDSSLHRLAELQALHPNVKVCGCRCTCVCASLHVCQVDGFPILPFGLISINTLTAISVIRYKGCQPSHGMWSVL